MLRAPLRPPFASNWQAGAFASLLIGLLCLPRFLVALGRPSRSDIYREVPSGNGRYDCAAKQIFETQGDIDILFLGSSFMWVGIDAPYVQDQLAARLGRPATVILMGFNFRGEELYFTVLRDVLAHRKVKLLVLSMPVEGLINGQAKPHPYESYWLDEQVEPRRDELSWLSRNQLYAESILGAPRRLLGALRVDTEVIDPGPCGLGEQLMDRGYDGRSFHEADIQMPSTPPEQFIYSRAHQDRFYFHNWNMNAFDRHFVQAMADEIRTRQIPTIFLNIRPYYDGMEQVHQVKEMQNWPEYLHLRPAAIVGIPPSELYAHMSGDQVKQYYYNAHMNRNGAQRFTRALTPTFLRLYENFVVNQGVGVSYL